MIGRSAVLVAALIGGGSRHHPLHTTLTEIVQPAGGTTVTITVRAFTEDLQTAVDRAAGPPVATEPRDSALARYVRARLILRDSRGTAIDLHWQHQSTTADLSWLTFQASAPPSLSGLRISNSMHTELFRDQVNIVQVKYSGRSESMLFTPGDNERSLP